MDGRITAGDREIVSIKSNYLPGSSYSFAMEVDFGRTYIGQFTLEVTLNPEIATQYYPGIGTSSFVIVVNPAILSKVFDNGKEDNLS